MQINNIEKLSNKLQNENLKWNSLAIAIDLADAIMKVILPNKNDWHKNLTRNSQGTGTLPDLLPQDIYRNQKQFTWFHDHPNAGSAKVALKLFHSDDCDLESHFYWFNEKDTKQRIAAATQFTTNWEDSEDTKQSKDNKVSIDFFLTSNNKKLLMVVSNKQNLRVLELSNGISNTQKMILTKKLSHVFDGISTTGNQEVVHQRIWDSLQISEVNKDFYNGIVLHFNKLNEGLILNNNKTNEEAKQFSSRLLGRLLFVWFLRKADLIDDNFSYFDIQESSTNYYQNKLKKLFFNTLNTRIEDRQHADLVTPYLNGGLFEIKTGDFDVETIYFPEKYFDDLYYHFNSFNFTTDESSPNYEIIAVDPEMLGQIFESLLATELDFLGNNKRSKTGAYYTPREVVNYMCKESLRDYLYEHLDNPKLNDGIDSLLDLTDSEFLHKKSTSGIDLWGVNSKVTLKNIREALDKVKIIDPAVGSGAFPIGMMQVLTKLYERISSGREFNIYKTKLNIIENNIYGVDINDMAIEIARLRTWLSLIIEDLNTHEIEPLPNLEFKFVSANSLVKLSEGQQSLFVNPELDKELDEIRSKYFNARKPHRKIMWQQKYYDITSKVGLFDDNRTLQLKSFDPFNNSTVSDFFDSGFMFGIENGFDIVIGNPPYIDSEEMVKSQPELRDYCRKHFDSAKGNWDIFVIFIEHGINLLADRGILSYIVPNKLTGANYTSNLRKLMSNYSIQEFRDYSNVDVFDDADVYPIVFRLVNKNEKTDINVVIMDSIDEKTSDVSISSNPFYNDIDWDVYFTDDIESVKIVNKIKLGEKLKTIAKVNGAATVAESYLIKESLVNFDSKQHNQEQYKKFINTGTIDRYKSLWSAQDTRYIKDNYFEPVINKNNIKDINETRLVESKKEKIIIAGMARYFEGYYDDGDYLAGKSTTIVYDSKIDLLYLLGLLNSKLLTFYYTNIRRSSKMKGGYYNFGSTAMKDIPIVINKGKIKELSAHVEDLMLGYKNQSNNIYKLEQEIDSIVYDIYSITETEQKFIEHRLRDENIILY